MVEYIEQDRDPELVEDEVEDDKSVEDLYVNVGDGFDIEQFELPDDFEYEGDDEDE